MNVLNVIVRRAGLVRLKMIRRFVVALPILITLVLPVEAQTLVDAFPSLSLTAPIDLQSPNDGTGRLFVAELTGRVKLFQNDPGVSTYETFLDLSSMIELGGEKGLLSIALHPDFASNGYLFVHYVGSPQTSIIARFTADPSNPDTVLAGSMQVLLKQVQPESNHNGGKILFGPDGYLYIGFGDGGGSHDPNDEGQSTTSLLGAILRIDVDGNGLPPDCGPIGESNYTIPQDNPFTHVSNPGCDEIWAYGLRNPWRSSFDADGTLWVGDVGQNCREEIDRVKKEGNYGWDVMEGNLCHPEYTDCTLTPPTDCSTAGLELPIIDYNRNSSSGGRSVTGGFVYRGAECAPFLTGSYIYGDYITDNVWALAFDGDSLISNELLFDAGFDVVSFAEDANKELYVLDAGGAIYKFDCSGLENVEVAYAAGWQQISVPVRTISTKVVDVFRNVNIDAPVYGFSDGLFGEIETVEPGRAYLAHFSEPDTVAYLGESVDPRSIEVAAGWNLVGPFETTVQTASVNPSSGVTILTAFFELSSGYSSVTELQPGVGYWVAVDSDGTLGIP